MTRRRAPAMIETPFESHVRAHGWCAVCKHRDDKRHHGAAHCAGNFRRQHPACTHDNRQPRFLPDLAAIRSITERQSHAS